MTLVWLLLLLLIVPMCVHCDISIIERLLTSINRIRRSVYPHAANMNYVVAAVTGGPLENKTKAIIETCKVDTSATEGQSFFQFNGDDDFDLFIEIEKQRANYDFYTDKCKDNNKCNDYRQMINPAVTAATCAQNDNCADFVYTFLCVYDKKVSSQPMPGKLYITGKPGSRCFFDGPGSTRKSINGLCQVKNDTNSTEVTPACKLTGCNDCRNFTAETCECGTCPAGCKMACAKEGTPCLNKGEDTSASECICKCVDGHKGRQCEITPEQYKNGIYLELNSTSMEPNSTLPFPSIVNFMHQHELQYAIWPHLKPTLAKYITDYCKNDTKNAKLCCGKEVDLGDSKTFPVDLKDPVEYGMASDGKNLMIVVNPVVDSCNTLCGPAPAFSDGFIEGLKKFLIDKKFQPNGWRTECYQFDCHTFLDIAKLKSYKTFVDEMYKDKCKPGTGGGGVARC